MTEWNDEPGEQQDPYSEPVSSTGRMLFYFFGVVVVVAVALAIGYTLGKRSAPPAVAGAPTVTAGGSGAAEPGASRASDPAATDAADSSAVTESPRVVKIPEGGSKES